MNSRYKKIGLLVLTILLIMITQNKYLELGQLNPLIRIWII